MPSKIITIVAPVANGINQIPLEKNPQNNKQ